MRVEICVGVLRRAYLDQAGEALIASVAVVLQIHRDRLLLLQRIHQFVHRRLRLHQDQRRLVLWTRLLDGGGGVQLPVGVDQV